MDGPIALKARDVLTVAGAVVAAFPFGWGLGVVAAYLIAGSEVGQLPALTVPLGIATALLFAVLPIGKATTRLTILAGGAVGFILLARLIP